MSETYANIWLSADLYGYLGMALSMTSFVLKDDRRLLQINFFAAIFWGLNGYLLGSLTALLTQLVGAGVTAYRLLESKESRVFKVGVASLFVATGLAALSWSGWSSLPVTVATLLLIGALAIAKGFWIRLLFLAANTAFLLHAVLYGSTPQIAATLLAYPFLLVGIYRTFRTNAQTGLIAP